MARVRVGDPDDARAARALLRDAGYVVTRGAGPADLLVVDEWAGENDPEVTHARATGTRVTVLAELVLARCRGPVVGVTGTAGKTSTCRALEAVLRACGRPVVISGTAPSANAWPDRSLAHGAAPDAVTIAELTSTHLCHMRHVRADVGVVTLIRPDHVELHGSVRAYVAAKRRLVSALGPADAVVLPCDDHETVRLAGECAAAPWWFGEDPAPDAPGAFLHAGGVTLCSGAGRERLDARAEGTALRAVLAAGAAALALGVAPAAAAAAMAAVRGVAHRMSRRPGPRGITIIDDSMAATPIKARAGVEQAGPGPLVCVVGGDDRPAGRPVHASAEEQAALRAALLAMRARARALVGFGPACDRVLDVVALDAREDGIGHALEAAVGLCPDGGTVLVAPMFPMRPEERALVAAPG